MGAHEKSWESNISLMKVHGNFHYGISCKQVASKGGDGIWKRGVKSISWNNKKEVE